MAFQSYPFFCLVGIALCLYYAAPARLRLWVLLAANAVFFLWADAASGIWLLFSVFSTWGCALLAEKIPGKGPPSPRYLLSLPVHLQCTSDPRLNVSAV